MEEMDTSEAVNIIDEEMMGRVTDSLEAKTYKYRELCGLLGEEPIDSKNSHGKASQLKRWERFFEFERKGHSIISNFSRNSSFRKFPGRLSEN